MHAFLQSNYSQGESKRLYQAFTNQDVVCTDENSTTVFNSDESNFNLVGSDDSKSNGVKMRNRLPNVWKIFIRLDGKINNVIYEHEHHVASSLGASFVPGSICMQDNAPYRSWKGWPVQIPIKLRVLIKSSTINLEQVNWWLWGYVVKL